MIVEILGHTHFFTLCLVEFKTHRGSYMGAHVLLNLLNELIYG